MWFKLDDGFATHPKILRAGIEATVLQIRALCYAAQNKTDGLLPLAVIPMLTTDMSVRAPDMVRFGLWDCRESEYFVHDYLEWNLSKAQYIEMKEKLSRAGRKGMRRRWKGITKVITNPVTTHDNPAITSLSTSTSTLNPLNSPNPESNPQSKKKSNGLCEFPSDFVLSEEMKTRAVALDLNPLQEFAKFRDHHLAKGSKMKDWSAAWRKWMRTGVEIKEARR